MLPISDKLIHVKGPESRVLLKKVGDNIVRGIGFIDASQGHVKERLSFFHVRCEEGAGQGAKRRARVGEGHRDELKLLSFEEWRYAASLQPSSNLTSCGSNNRLNIPGKVE